MSRLEQDRAAALAASKASQAKAKRDNAEQNGGMTGWPPGMLQDDSRELSRALANAPHARQHVKEACAAIKTGNDAP